MSLRKIHIQKISSIVSKKLAELKLIKTTAEDVENKIAAIITQNMEDERALDLEAHKLLDKNRKLAGMELDEQKVFSMIKKELAKKKNFVL